jgi:hypothetical protein
MEEVYMEQPRGFIDS